MGERARAARRTSRSSADFCGFGRFWVYRRLGYAREPGYPRTRDPGYTSKPWSQCTAAATATYDRFLTKLFFLFALFFDRVVGDGRSGERVRPPAPDSKRASKVFCCFEASRWPRAFGGFGGLGWSQGLGAVAQRAGFRFKAGANVKVLRTCRRVPLDLRFGT